MTTGRIGIRPTAIARTRAARRAWRDQRFVAAVALTLAAYALSEVFDAYARGTEPLATFAAAFRLIALMFALLGAAEALERSQQDRTEKAKHWHERIRRLEEQVESSTSEWQERAHEARSALSAIELAVFSAGRLGPGLPGMPLADAVAAEVGLLRSLLTEPETPSTRAPFRVSDAAAGPIHIEQIRGATITDAIPRDLEAHGAVAAVTEIVRNLLENAARHAPGAAVKVSAERAGDRTLLRIQDDGPGIDPAARESVFGRGVRRPGGGGSGLGLYISRRLAERQDGTLSIDPARPGTCFVLDLPAAP